MPVRDQLTNQEIEMAGIELALSGNATVAGAIIDTADFDLGVYFIPTLIVYIDGAHAVIIEEGDDSGLSDATVVGAEKLIGSLPSLTALPVNNGVMQCVGVHSTKRYVRASYVSTGVTTGATGVFHAIKGAETVHSSSVAGFDV